MKSSKIRSTFLDYFKAKNHLVMPSFSLIPQDDPTLLLIGAGMAPLKPFFTGEKVPPNSRVATCQKCIRTPDIDRVGLTGRHATYFEMLGNFSFGDYFKEEAITWSWDLVLNGFKMPLDRLWVSVYHEDEEAFKIWNEHIGISSDRIKLLGKEDNFWEIGLGPCGPCSEIYYDLGPSVGCGEDGCTVGCDCDRYLEIWNLVFTQFSREESGELVELDKKNIDTGAGLERLAMAMQGASSIYETDLIKPVYDYYKKITGKNSSDREIPLRIVTEHSRGTVFMIADGIIPSNEGRGYVLRRLMRRAIRYGKILGIEGCFITDSIPIIAEIMEDHYPELKDRIDYIKQVTSQEEKRFQSTLAQGMDILDDYLETMKGGEKVLPGDYAFKLYDTFGFPIDLTEEILRERGIEVDHDSFQLKLKEQQNRARAAIKQLKGKDDANLYESAKKISTKFTGYIAHCQKARIVHAIVDGKEVQSLSEGMKADVIIDSTPFYAESGGQIGDTGIIKSKNAELRVDNTFYSPFGQIVHRVSEVKGKIEVGEEVEAEVNYERRMGICRSHSATHLLHRALRSVLGEHVTQAGSLVDCERLRFDFNHFSALTEKELNETEEEVNRVIMNNITMQASMTSMEEAKKLGAIALFVEKYEDNFVRVISTGEYTKELCGGTHVSSTGEIGLFKIVSEESIGSGLRRISALVGMSAYKYVKETENILDAIAVKMNTSRLLLSKRFDEYQHEFKMLQKQNNNLEQLLVQHRVEAMLSTVYTIEGINIVKAEVDRAGIETLRIMADQLKDRFKSVLVLLGSVEDGKVLLICAMTDDLVKKGFHAGKIVKDIAKIVNGGGGGKADMAQAGGNEPASMPAAFSKLDDIIYEKTK